MPDLTRAPAAFLSEGDGFLQQDMDLNPCNRVQVAEGTTALIGLEFSINIFAVVYC